VSAVMVYRFMSEHRDEYTIREKDVSFWGRQRRLLQMGEGGSVRGRKEADTEPADLIRRILVFED
jgi:hypothetical protein